MNGTQFLLVVLALINGLMVYLQILDRREALDEAYAEGLNEGLEEGGKAGFDKAVGLTKNQ